MRKLLCLLLLSLLCLLRSAKMSVPSSDDSSPETMVPVSEASLLSSGDLGLSSAAVSLGWLGWQTSKI